MFVQVTQGKTSQAEALYEAMERWRLDLAAGAAGWLGTTAGVTDDGRAIAVYRFESEEAARRMSERPEQAQWWTDAKQFFDAEPTVQFSSEVTLDLQGDPDEAGFVQFQQGRVSDPARVKELMAKHSGKRATMAPMSWAASSWSTETVPTRWCRTSRRRPRPAEVSKGRFRRSCSRTWRKWHAQHR